jgi:hypothetical protein
MKRLLLFVLVGSALWISCSDLDDNISFDPSLSLTFSSDTLTFDTLLSNRRSPTKIVTIFNDNSEAIQLKSIRLALGENSDYQTIINGRVASEVNNEIIQGGDSIRILVEMNITPRDENLPYLVKDSIVLEWNNNSAHVKLVSWGQDGTEISNAILCNETWTNSRPYIIKDTVLVEANCQLNIEAGTNVFFENDAVLFIQGTLKALGDTSSLIIFRNSRFDGVFDAVPGQWNGIYFLEGSTDNEISHAEIFNGRVGLRIGTPDDDDIPDVLVRNTKIFNMSLAGVLAFTSDVRAVNTLIHSCGTYLIGNFAGGNYSYRHCTFSNDANLFISDEPSVQFSDNIIIDQDQLLTENLSVELLNSIVWGVNDEELLINNGGGAQVTAVIQQNIIRSTQNIDGNITSLEFNYPGFTSSFIADYSLDTLSNAKDIGLKLGVTNDILGLERDSLPDLGAYERIENE